VKTLIVLTLFAASIRSISTDPCKGILPKGRYLRRAPLARQSQQQNIRQLVNAWQREPVYWRSWNTQQWRPSRLSQQRHKQVRLEFWLVTAQGPYTPTGGSFGGLRFRLYQLRMSSPFASSSTISKTNFGARGTAGTPQRYTQPDEIRDL